MRSTLKAAMITMIGIGAGLAARALRRVLLGSQGEHDGGEGAQAGTVESADQPGGGVAPANGGGPKRGSPDGPTRAELYEEAKRRGIKGRSQMTKAQLAEALSEEG